MYKCDGPVFDCLSEVVLEQALVPGEYILVDLSVYPKHSSFNSLFQNFYRYPFHIPSFFQMLIFHPLVYLMASWHQLVMVQGAEQVLALKLVMVQGAEQVVALKLVVQKGVGCYRVQT